MREDGIDFVLDAGAGLEDPRFQISPSAYEWTSRLFDLLRKFLKVQVEMHHDEGQIESGDIFVFNHFARFETFIPQYLIYKKTGAFCRSVASGEFFAGDDQFSNYLASVGAVPNDHPGLFAFLTREIFRGRKVIVFPEGGMVKDRRVIDEAGEYSVYSRAARERRKHHTGAAVLALAVEAVKVGVKDAQRRGNIRRIEAWADAAGLASVDALVAAAKRPTRIVPANITFYPIRVSDNLLRKGAELLNKGLSRRMSEELLIEGNILLKHTDMDIRLGESIRADAHWSLIQKTLVARVVRGFGSLDEIFSLNDNAGWWAARLLAGGMRRSALRLRDTYMLRMYAGVTVNLSHLASRLILTLMDNGVKQISAAQLRLMLYLCVKRAQREPSLHLHQSVRNPDMYGELPDGACAGFDQFIDMATTMGLLVADNGTFRFLEKLSMEHTFDSVRLENLIEVYANEIAPLKQGRKLVDESIREMDALAPRRVAEHLFDDMKIAHAWDLAHFSKPRYQAINLRETARESGEPFLLLPKDPSPLGVVLVHGFLASPSELRSLGERLYQRGHAVIGVRLKGHGTSPWDLRERSWKEWLASVRAGCRLMEGLTPRYCIAGFSTGGALALVHAATHADGPVGVAAAAVPVIFRNKNMRFVPLVHGANRLLRSISSAEGIMPFRPNQSEHPHINYYQIPIRGLYELRLLVDALRQHVAGVDCPVLLLQGDRDPVVDPGSVEILGNLLAGKDVRINVVSSRRHGILYEDIDGAQNRIVAFVAELEKRAAGVPAH
ncbi:MAG TPA: alpha/beta hydrolase [Gammaproteobacteria bacterium]